MRTFVRIAAGLALIGAATAVTLHALNPQPLPPGREREHAVAPATDAGAASARDASSPD